jgi:hypothetical protein
VAMLATVAAAMAATAAMAAVATAATAATAVAMVVLRCTALRSVLVSPLAPQPLRLLRPPLRPLLLRKLPLLLRPPSDFAFFVPWAKDLLVARSPC